MPSVASAGRAEYFAAAKDLLLAEGLPALRIGRLCRKLGVTSGSFYHHFGSWARFVAGLADEWAGAQVELAEAPGATPAAVAGRFVDTAPHALEAVIRAWTYSDEVVAAAQRRVDRARHDALRAAQVAAGVEAVRADLLATLTVTILAGVQQLGSGADVPSLHQLLAEAQTPAPTPAPTPSRH